MFRSRRSAGVRRSRGSRSRHGRDLRSSVAGPLLPQLTGRIPRFTQVVHETLSFLRTIAPDEMEGVRVMTAGMPLSDQHGDGIDRWRIDPPHDVVLYRVPIERLAGVSLSGERDQDRYREIVERTVVAAVAELLDGRLDDRLRDEFGDDL